MSTLDARTRRLVTTGTQGQAGVLGYQTVQPLYSAFALGAAALPSTMTFFGYAVGDNVPGAGVGTVAATRFHTNLQTSGRLPAPELFTAVGLRVFMPQFALAAGPQPAVGDESSATANANADTWDDLMLLYHSCWLEFQVGTKLYAQHPLWMFPPNTGFAGSAALANDDGTAATIGALNLVLPHLQGVGFQLSPFMAPDGSVRGPVLIAESQNFAARIRCEWGTNPSMVDARYVFVFIDGHLTRASQ